MTFNFSNFWRILAFFACYFGQLMYCVPLAAERWLRVFQAFRAHLRKFMPLAAERRLRFFEAVQMPFAKM